MNPTLQRAIVGGSVLVVFGAFFARYAYVSLPIGTFSAMGPGMFPLLVGLAIVLLGLLIAGPAMLRVMTNRMGSVPAEPWERVEWRAFLAIAAGIAAYVALVNSFGQGPAVVALIAIGAQADSKLKPASIVLMSLGLSVSAYLLFNVALNLPLEFLKWPF